MTKMKIVVACDSFKGSLPSAEVNRAVAAGLTDASADVIVEEIAVADGGEGTVDALVAATGGTLCHVEVDGPTGSRVTATYGIAGDGTTAVIEMAAASGLTLVDRQLRNPLVASSWGTGQMILDAIARGCTTIIMGIGGSATVDGGAGLLAVLGAGFYDACGDAISRPRGADLARIAAIDASGLSDAVGSTRFVVACDVDNPLYGPRGAAKVFGPQKGASPADVELLEAGMRRYAGVVASTLGADFASVAGAGAAGGVGFAMKAFLHAGLTSGIDTVLDAAGFDSRIDGADVVITGEGRLDRQTLMGKTPHGVARRASAKGIPVVGIAGSVEAAGELTAGGFDAVFPITAGPCTLADAMQADVARANLRRTASQIMRLLAISGTR